MEEIWKKVRGKEEYAEISNMGQIHYYATGKGRCPEERWTYGNKSGGYLYACIGYVNKGVHQWVYLTFVGDIPEGMQVNHIDEDKHNNRLDNLNLKTPKENTNWGTGNARRAASNRGKKRSEETKKKISDAKRGKPNPKLAAALKTSEKAKIARTKAAAAQSKPVQALDPTTLEVVYEFASTREAERQFGFAHSAVAACCRNCFNRPGNNVYKGLIWRFIENKFV